MAKTTTAAVPYGCAPEYDGPPLTVLARTDFYGLYRRPSIDLATGDVLRGPDRAVLHDESTLPTRYHLTWVGKGFTLVRLKEHGQ